MRTLLTTQCPYCPARVMRVEDIDTDETLVLDVDPVEDGDVELFPAGPVAVARRRGRRGPRPVYRLHSCPAWDAVRAAAHAVDVADAHAPGDPGIEQAGWRAP